MGERSGHRAGLILAGGYSRRFGNVDKALVRIDERPMIDRVVEAVGAATDVVIVNCRSDQCHRFTRSLGDRSAHLAFAIDPVEDAGPLAGLAAGLAVHGAPVTVVASCDQPFLEPAVIDNLCRELGGPTRSSRSSTVRPRPRPSPSIPTGGSRRPDNGSEPAIGASSRCSIASTSTMSGKM